MHISMFYQLGVINVSEQQITLSLFSILEIQPFLLQQIVAGVFLNKFQI